MKRLLNTLYVTSHGAYLAKDGETVLVRKDGETQIQVPVHTLGGIVCIGSVAFSPPLLGLCAERGVGVSFLSANGRFLARMSGPVSGNVLLRRTQYRWADEEERAARLAGAMVLGKVANCRQVLMRTAREHEAEAARAALTDAATHLRTLVERLREQAALDTVRGWEGDAARTYFGAFDHLITAQREGFPFSGRSRRPPLDAVNALLSFLYTLLVHDVRSALEGVGLDPAVGFLHRDRPGRPGLALDLMEELRPVLADRLALSLINRQQIRPEGFVTRESGAVEMDEETRRTVLVAYQKRKQEEITHPFLEERMEMGLLPHVQSLLLARHLRGDHEAYPPLLWR